MAELLKTKEAELTTAELASYGVAPKQPDGPKLVKSQETETLDKAAAVSKPMPLFSEFEMGGFRSQWSFAIMPTSESTPNASIEGENEIAYNDHPALKRYS